VIYDKGTELTLTLGASADIYYGNAYDLAGGGDGVPQLLAGERLFLQFEVTVAFTAAAGTPLLQFGACLDDSNPPSTSALVLAMTGGGVSTKVGLDAGQLTLGRTFHLSLPPWEDILELTGANWPDTKTPATLAAFRAMRYLGLVAVNPMAIGSHSWNIGGEVKARITTVASGTAVLSNIFPSRMGVS